MSSRAKRRLGKRGPPKGYALAELEARLLLGPQGAAKYVPSMPKYKYQIGQKFVHEGRALFGVVGQGISWTTALEDAKLNFNLWLESQNEVAATTKVED